MFGRLRERYEAFMRPIGRSLGASGISPNIVTTISLLLAILAAFAYGMHFPILGGVGIVASGLVDMLDGAIARATAKSSRFGAVYDHVLDRYAEFVILLGIGLGGFADWYWIVFCLFGMIMASFVRAKAESVGGLKSCTVGIAERQEKLILLIVGSLLQPLIGSAILSAVIIVGILSHVTVLQRLNYTFNQTRGVRLDL